MGFGRNSGWWPGGLIVLAMALMFPAPAQAMSDELPGHQLNSPPHRTATPFDFTTPSFDTTAYTTATEEVNRFTQLLGCGAWGSRTAWLRFSTAVAGNLRVTVDSGPGGGGYDAFFKVYTSASDSVAAADLKELDCVNAVKDGPGEDYIHGFELPAGVTAYIQILAVCANRLETTYCSPEEIAASSGGPTQVRVRFNPQDSDQDGVADSLDRCPAQPGTAAGCPDRDSDGVADQDDFCPDAAGRDSAGCDGDGDGHRARAAGGKDCNDNDPKTHPGARERPGSKVDRNCDGKLRPYPTVSSKVAVSYLIKRNRYVGFAGFKVLDLKRGMRIQIACKGRGCPFSGKIHRVKRNRAASTFATYLRNHTLAPGSRVTITIARPNHIGKSLRYRLPKRGKPVIREFCVPVGKLFPLRKKC